MKKRGRQPLSLLWVLGCLICVLLLYLGAATAQNKKNFLADRHGEKGTSCSACHKESPPGEAVPTAVCLGCHGPYAKLAERTGKEEINPHGSHQGDQTCESCHHGHKQSVDQCSSCHTFGLKVP